jgi:hypothetical protein
VFNTTTVPSILFPNPSLGIKQHIAFKMEDVRKICLMTRTALAYRELDFGKRAE